jgi:alcohol dehydrogenase (cytochrome c)
MTLLSVLLFTVLSVSGSAQTKEPTQAELSGAAANTTDWLHPNHDYPFSLDPSDGRMCMATGNPAPDFYGDVRQGHNLYTNALVVLDARTGKLVWHYQATPRDTHDWDLTQASPLFTAEVQGKSRRLVTVTGKDGLLRVLDRETCALMYEVAVTRRENATAPVTVEGVYACPGVLGGVQLTGRVPGDLPTSRDRRCGQGFG